MTEPTPDAHLDQAYARGIYSALLVMAVLPVVSLFAASLELALLLATVRDAAGVAPVTLFALATPLVLLGIEVVLFVAVLRYRATAAGLRGASWVLPIIVAAASVFAYVGSVGLRVVTTKLIATHGALALATHTQRLVPVQVAAGLAGAIIVATVLLVAFARSRSR